MKINNFKNKMNTFNNKYNSKIKKLMYFYKILVRGKEN